MHENFPKSYNTHAKNLVITKIGQDMRGIVKYCFNKQGFRSDIDFDQEEKKSVAFFGNLYTSAIGIEWRDGFAQKTCDLLGLKCYNFSQGCAALDNKEIVETVKYVLGMKTYKPLLYVVQFCQLERRFNTKNQNLTLEIDKEKNIHEFIELFDTLEQYMTGERWLFFGIDDTLRHNLPDRIVNHERCLCWNPVIIDKILQGIAGEKWHKMMAYGFTKKIQIEMPLAKEDKYDRK